MRKILLTLFLIMITAHLSLAQDDSQTPYEIALERILEAEETGTTFLYFSGLSLSELPPEIGNLTNLQVLDLKWHQLSSLPPEIGNLVNLEGLDLIGNQLNSLPPEIGNLSNLQFLDLNDNQLSSLPPEIGNLSNLHYLDLSSNELSSLPPEFSNLNVQYLDLRNNQLTTLPAEMGKMSSLQLLHIYDNPLISPPEEVIAEGIPAILDYLNNQALWHLKRLIMSIASGVGFIALVILGIRYRWNRNRRKPKAKRGES